MYVGVMLFGCVSYQCVMYMCRCAFVLCCVVHAFNICNAYGWDIMSSM